MEKTILNPLSQYLIVKTNKISSQNKCDCNCQFYLDNEGYCSLFDTDVSNGRCDNCKTAEQNYLQEQKDYAKVVGKVKNYNYTYWQCPYCQTVMSQKAIVNSKVKTSQPEHCPNCKNTQLQPFYIVEV